MSKKISKEETEQQWKKLEHAEMDEEVHQIELKDGYEQDEKYEESED
jgi:hypothetical protein